jgi:hypothetical protein
MYGSILLAEFLGGVNLNHGPPTRAGRGYVGFEQEAN